MIAKNNGIKLTDEQRLCWLQLIRSENVGAATFWWLLKKYNTAKNALDMLPHLAQRGGKKTIKIAKREDVEREIEEANRINAHFICAGEPNYPPLLRQMDCIPPVICVKGDQSLLQKKAVSIVGSRNSSIIGIRVAHSFAQDLGEAGFVIVSGFARGVDSAAHKGGLISGTIAVMAGGINHIYPTENEHLYQSLLDHGGLILSELPLNFVPRAIDFPRRNRIIAGLSLGILVVEAAMRSGSLITARMANDIGRHVFAIPGSIHDPRARGTNELIKNGAHFITNAQDIVEILNPLNNDTKAKQLTFLDEESFPYIAKPHMPPDDFSGKFEDITDLELARIISCLSFTPVDLASLSHYSKVSLTQLHLALIELEIAGRIIRHTDGLISLRP